MKRTGTLAMAAALAFCPCLFAQGPATKPSPALPADILGPQLIMWSQLQQPHPVPQPLPPPERADQQGAGQSANPQDQQPMAQTFTGTIVKESGKYVLKASETSEYQIDDQEKARIYEGKQVRIAGSLDAKSNTLYIKSIELLS